MPENSSADSISLEQAPEDAGKYVRTFATDAAALEKGQTPDFTHAEPAAVPAASIAPSAPVEVVPLPPSLIEEAAPTRAPAAPQVAPLHTYTSDFAEKVKAENASQADIVAAEQDKPYSAPLLKEKRDRPIIALALVLVLLGAIAAAAAYWYAASPAAAPLAPAPTLRIFVDETQNVSGSGDTLEREIASSVASPPAAGAVRLLAFASSSASVFSALNLPVPSILARNLESAGSLAGVVNASNGASPFFILAVDSYSDTFAGMLAWEPSMARDLAGLYPTYTATSSAAFKDEVVLNHDVRALVDSSGRTILLYGYFDQNTLLIARDELALGVLLDRLTNSHTEKQ